MYTQAFESAVEHLMLYEIGGFVDVTDPGFLDGTNPKACGYTNDPTDAGGETKYGIAKNANPSVDVTNLDWEGAKAVYAKKYWMAGHCDQLSGRVAALHFDGCVNNGLSGAGKFVQRAVGVYPDGAIAPGTLAEVNKMDPIDLCNAICDQRTKYYNDIVAAKPDQAKYLKGWLRRIDEMRTFTTDPNGNF